MKTVIISAIAAVALGIAILPFYSGPANAACPPGTRYDCVQMPNGKMSCGCR